MKLSTFYYDLPQSLIAQYPSKEREDSRLLVVEKNTGRMEVTTFNSIMDYFDDKDVFVVNNSKVFKSRLYCTKEKTGARIEVFLLRELNKNAFLWDALVDPARKIRVGNKLYFEQSENLVAEVIDNTTSRGRTIKFLWNGSYESFRDFLESIGEMPLPKYIKRPNAPIDDERYNTVFAKVEGAVTLPAAGSHFSKKLLKLCEISGIRFAEITLHQGISSLKPLEVEDITKHKMDAEYFNIQQEACDIVNDAIINKRKVCAVGATTARALESCYTSDHFLKKGSGWTNKFINPPYDFNIPNALITSFHLPKTCLFILTSAFAGPELTLEIYQRAVKEKFRFLCYGDALLVI
ncbi:MAG: tRNA preQ1(34) S-adenosylmethionine ribosyltransferase-isomerase QueA [Alphaproteobacteria bacterium]|nr:tRNA preQ1(34) S-adenosylmethionine ribosyltransferase-isomerase QueA [Alphaproteobacteria bacterium]